MTTERKIKRQAKALLAQNNWTTCIGALSILLLFFLFITTISGTLLFLSGAVNTSTLEIKESKTGIALCCSLLTFILYYLCSPAITGFLRLCYGVACGKAGDINDIFYYFRGKTIFLRTLRLNFLLFLLFAAILFICFLPLNIYTGFSSYLQTMSFSGIFMFISFVLWAGGFAAALTLCLKFAFVPFLFTEDETKKSFSYIQQSFAVSKKYSASLLRLFFSFIPWLLLCILIFPIMYVIPYMSTAFANSVKWILMLEKEDIPTAC